MTPVNELSKILTAVKNERRGGAPHDSWVSRERDILMMQVRNTMDLNAKPGIGDKVRHLFGIFLPLQTMALAGRAVGLFVLVFATMIGGGAATANLYRSAEPGAAGYSFKVAVEKLQLAIAPNAEYRARLFADFADRRMDEVAKLAEAGRGRAEDHLPTVLASFSEDIEGLLASLATLETSHDVASLESAKLMERKMTAYQSVLTKSAAVLSPVHHEEFLAVRDLVDDLSVKAMAVIVEKHMEGDSEAPRGVLVAKFEDHLNDAEAKAELAATANSSPEKTQQARAAIAEAKQLVKEEKYEAALTKMAEVVELTKEVEAANQLEAKPTDSTTDQTATTDKTEPQKP